MNPLRRLRLDADVEYESYPVTRNEGSRKKPDMKIVEMEKANIVITLTEIDPDGYETLISRCRIDSDMISQVVNGNSERVIGDGYV